MLLLLLLLLGDVVLVCRWLHTMVRDREAPQDVFQDAVHRLSRLVCAKALDTIPASMFSTVTITTPTGCPAQGPIIHAKKVRI